MNSSVFTGDFSLKIAGKQRHFKFGTLAYALFCEAEGVKLTEFGERMSDPKPFTMFNLFHSAAVAHSRINKKEIDFTLEDVTVWFDEAGTELMSILNQSLGATTEDTTEKKRKAVKGGKAGNS